MVIGTKLKKFYQKNNNIIKKSLQLIQMVSYSKFIKKKKSIDFLTNQTKCKNNNNQTNLTQHLDYTIQSYG